MVAIALPWKRWHVARPSRAVRWLGYFLLVWLSWEIKFPFALLFGHQLVGQYWTAENGPFYSISLSMIILVGDSLLCQALAQIKLASRWRAEEGVPDKSRRWLAEGVLTGLLLPMPPKRRRRVFIRVARAAFRMRDNRATIFRLGLLGLEIGIAAGVVAYALVVRDIPSPSPTLHHYQWTYDLWHIAVSAVFGRNVLLFMVQSSGERSRGWMSRRRAFLYVAVMLCLIGYVVLSWYAPEPIRFITGLRVYMGPLGEHIQSRLFTWGPMAHPWP